LFIGLYSCKVSEKPGPEVVDVEPQEIVQDTATYDDPVGSGPALYRGEQTRHFKLIHTKLDVSFDWEKQYMNGTAHLILQPYFYEQEELVLDAKDFDIHQISILKGSDQVNAGYEYDGSKIRIELGDTYSRLETLHVQIEYTARPNEGQDATGFANDKKGLYFIDPLDNIEGKPQQLWTQGETSANSKWFPTIDNPNQKSTQETFITVDAKFRTLSNGKLIYSKSNPDGTRTDYWKMEKPHAPYLFMMAVGEFSVVEDEWNGIKVDYYVEPEFAPYASDIFGNTPEMIGYFSEILNYPYPWEKYSQVVVRDFVSGAMENTTASVFMEDLNVNSRELIDYDWDDIIAHELFHQWFGDLVTCESWANLPLNESFATYAEYLWKNHKYGKNEADYFLYEEQQTYLDEAEEKQEDLIRFDYIDEDDMFDSHSYAKGGLILHMLRNYLGDEAFFKSLEYYLKSHAYSKAEVHELRLSFEHISGEDLNWFFNQWFLNAGHPVIEVEEDYDAASEVLTVKVWQKQDADLYPVYKLPLIMDLWDRGEKEEYLIEIDRPYQEFEFEDVKNPDLVLIDSDHVLVGEINHQKASKQLKYQYDHYGNDVRARYEAFKVLMEDPADSISGSVLTSALADPFWVIREEALMVLENDTTDLFEKNKETTVDLAKNDPNSLVRAEAIAVLGEKAISENVEIFRSNLYDSSYSVAGNALYVYLQTGSDDILSVLDSLKGEDNFNISSSIADYYITNEDYARYPWFVDKLRKFNGSDLWYFIKLFGMYLVEAPQEIADQGIGELFRIATDHPQFFNRLSAYQSLQLFMEIEGVAEKLDEIREKEKDPRILPYYK
jgi:aminopeptidase N